jgi:putative membrane protein
MKTIKLFFLMAIPVVLLSCNSNPNRNRNKTDDNDKNNVNQSSMAVTDNNKDNNSTATKDQDFVKEAASGGLMEVELGKFAQQHATNQRVKNFGAMMVKDHSKANDELKTIASSKNIALSPTMENADNKKVTDLQNERGTDFDKKYIKEMVDDHEKDVDNFKKQAENGSDPEIKAFATKVLPILIAHQDSAKSIRDALK